MLCYVLDPKIQRFTKSFDSFSISMYVMFLCGTAQHSTAQHSMVLGFNSFLFFSFLALLRLCNGFVAGFFYLLNSNCLDPNRFGGWGVYVT